MSFSGINAPAYDLNALTAQISESVRNIKATSLQNPAFQPVGNQASEVPAQNFSLRNFAVSYLEPRALDPLQRIRSEAPDELSREGRERRLKPDTERDENKTLKASHQDGISELDFNSELKRAFSATDYAKVTAVYRQAVQVNVPEVTLLFGGNPASENSSRYAAEAYTAAADLTQAKEPLINLMHNNNRNFDYKI